MILGLRTVIYHVPDLAAAKSWYAQAFGTEPYFDEPYYVGFNVGGFELGLDPDPSTAAAGRGGVVPFWGVPDASIAVRDFAAAGATTVESVKDVGGGIRVATVADPYGNLIGLIENPHFALPKAG